MRVVFAVDAIFAPLTGIGRYALELATRLSTAPDVSEVRYLGMWSWSRGAPIQAGEPTGQLNHLSAPSVIASLRRSMATSALAVEIYDRVAEIHKRQLLRQARGMVLHSPNYFLPQHDGPMVATVHDLSIYRFPELHPAARRRYFDLAFERSLRRADALITDSETVRQELIRDFSVSPEKVTSVHLGVDQAFHPHTSVQTDEVLARYGLTNGGFLLTVATLEPRKKLDNLISGYALLPASVRLAYPLVIAGAAGWLNERAQAMIEQGRAQGWLRYLGYIPQSDLPAIYASARGFAMISIYEGFGLPVLEALASGVPVLTSDCSCLPEVADGAALLVNPIDIDQVCVQLERLLMDSVWRGPAIKKGLRRAAELTWQRCMEKTIAVYRSVN